MNYAKIIEHESFKFPKLKEAECVNIKNPCLIEEKLDGEALILFKGHAYGRRVSSVTERRENKWDSLPDWIQEQAVDVPVMGELHIPGMDSTVVKTALVQGRDEGWNRILASMLEFTAHTLLEDYITKRNHIMYPNEHRAILSEFGFYTPKVHQGLYYVNVTEDSIKDLKKIAERSKIEGFVLKERVNDLVWHKVKVTKTLDCVITGTKSGKGKYLNLIGALTCSVYKDGNLIEIANISGMTDKERVDMTRLKKDLNGMVVEVEHNGFAAKGRLKNPRFIRIRDDKNPKECLWID